MSEAAPPLWLSEEAEIGALLHAVLDRFDAQPGATRQRAVLFDAERFLPSLARGDAGADQTWALVRELAALGVCTLRRARGNPLDPVWRGAKLAFPPDREALLRSWLQREAAKSPLQAWREAVLSRANEFSADPEILLSRRIAIAGRTDDEVVAALLGIGSLSGPLSLRQLSARAFWGDSKVLDDRADLLRALFPRLQLRERPLVAAVHLPQLLDEVLFIENQDTYALAVAGGLPAVERAALVYAAGFRGAATRIRHRDGVLLHYAGPGVAEHRARYERFWFGAGDDRLRLSFWGDLDFAGMQILKSLRARFGNVQAWRPGYAPMVEALREEIAHRTEDRAQVDPGATGCEYADGTLLPIIRRCGYLDQEWIVPGAVGAEPSALRRLLRSSQRRCM